MGIDVKDWKRTGGRVVAIGLGLALLGLAALLFWYNVIRDTAPDAFALTSSETAVETTPTDGTEPVNLDGTWTISSGSEAGYRVVEDIAGGLQDFEAVGRTSQVTGSVTIEADESARTGSATQAELVVDVASIESDSRNRDNQFRGRIMQADDFPTATFTLTAPIDLEPLPARGAAATYSAAGQLTMHGVTRDVSAEISGQLLETQLELVGSIPVVFTDYEIGDPSVERIVSVRDEGLIEFHLFLTRS